VWNYPAVNLLRERGRRGAEISLTRTTPEQRAEWGRKGGLARAAKLKAARKEKRRNGAA
jgi:hypothetical protein